MDHLLIWVHIQYREDLDNNKTMSVSDGTLEAISGFANGVVLTLRSEISDVWKIKQ